MKNASIRKPSKLLFAERLEHFERLIARMKEELEELAPTELIEEFDRLRQELDLEMAKIRNEIKLLPSRVSEESAYARIIAEVRLIHSRIDRKIANFQEKVSAHFKEAEMSA